MIMSAVGYLFITGMNGKGVDDRKLFEIATGGSMDRMPEKRRLRCKRGTEVGIIAKRLSCEDEFW